MSKQQPTTSAKQPNSGTTANKGWIQSLRDFFPCTRSKSDEQVKESGQSSKVADKSDHSESDA